MEEAFNEEMTQKVQSNEKMKQYIEWAQTNGVIMDKLIFPAAFGPNENFIVGSAAKENIRHNEAFIFVPNKLLITVERARSSEIGYIFDLHDSIFKANEDRDFLTLLVFMMYEHQKGEQSLWYPYFNAIDPGDLPSFWDNYIINTIDDRELRAGLVSFRQEIEDDWMMILKLLKIYSPKHFDLEKCNYQLYKRCTAFIATRCFGWGLPTTIVAPIADSFNHNPKSNNVIDIINKRYHLTDNKAYIYQLQWSQDDNAEDDFDKSSSKQQYIVTKLYKEDQDIIENEDYLKIIGGQELYEDQVKQKKTDEVSFAKFKTHQATILQKTLQDDQKPPKFNPQQQEIWDLGYSSSDHSQDDDQDDIEEDIEDSAFNEDLKRKILSGNKQLNIDDYENIQSNTRLREIYSYRWWKDDDQDNYFVMVNKGKEDIKAGEQIFYGYGKRSNSYLLQNYGFSLDEKNLYNSLEFRVIVSVHLPQVLTKPLQVFPDQDIYEDQENLAENTEFLRIQSYRLSDTMLKYLRSSMQNSYQGEDKQHIMISSPAVIEFELLVINFALEILELQVKFEQRTNLEEDLDLYQKVSDYRLKFVLLYNIERKKISRNHIKLLKVLRAILERIQSKQESFSHASYRRVEGIEDEDSEYLVFKRRMGIRDYLRQLKLNLFKINKASMEKKQLK